MAEPALKPNYISYDERLSTYSKDWNKQCSRTSESLAEAGFYMVGTLRSFSRHITKDVWTEHAFWFPWCEFVIVIKGEEFIDQVIRENKYGIQRSLQTNRDDILHEWMLSGLAWGALKRRVTSYPELLNVMILRYNEKGEPFKDQIEFNKFLVNYRSKNNMNATENETTPPIAKIEELTCKVCMVYELGISFTPCGHMICTKCSTQLSDCPICRNKIKFIQQLYFS
ncbi:unnamed protein product [Medioppia subpectinata]|uniref:RING-type domain-containing protein n=1 Tax=Medioppia subpectinata TaxID=1979941 RepID=A0A7R9PX07_9ACAR|nr:unnamed protein product [Medioppia subpectinata]CAG2104518.1 unnamed protein product [Medioppia subpectinata]